MTNRSKLVYMKRFTLITKILDMINPRKIRESLNKI